MRKLTKPFLDKNPKAGYTIKFFGATQVAQDAIEAKEFQLVDVVPIKLELE